MYIFPFSKGGSHVFRMLWTNWIFDMNRIKLTVVFVLAVLSVMELSAQTAKSLFWKKDNVQVEEIVSETGKIGRASCRERV